jgi:DNA-binding NarL/FixJ family response regulator
MSGPIRIAILEGSPDVHVAMASLLAAEPDVQVVQHARTVAECTSLDDAAVDVLIVDLRVLGASDGRWLRALRQRYPRIRVVLTSSEDDEEYRIAAARLPADAWVSKTRLAGELLTVLRRLVA